MQSTVTGGWSVEGSGATRQAADWDAASFSAFSPSAQD
jgi:hypothetical protein